MNIGCISWDIKCVTSLYSGITKMRYTMKCGVEYAGLPQTHPVSKMVQSLGVGMFSLRCFPVVSVNLKLVLLPDGPAHHLFILTNTKRDFKS